MIRLFAAMASRPMMSWKGSCRASSGLPGARWRPLESLHLTLRFFGEISETTAEDLAS